MMWSNSFIRSGQPCRRLAASSGVSCQGRGLWLIKYGLYGLKAAWTVDQAAEGGTRLVRLLIASESY